MYHIGVSTKGLALLLFNGRFDGTSTTFGGDL